MFEGLPYSKENVCVKYIAGVFAYGGQHKKLTKRGIISAVAFFVCVARIEGIISL